MKRVKSLVVGQKYIAQVIDGDKVELNLNGDRFHTDETHKPYWNDKELATVESLKVPGATEGNIAVFNNAGGVEDSGKSFNDLSDNKVKLFERSGTGDWTVDLESNMFNVEYVVTRLALRQSGTLKVRNMDMLEMDVFGDDADVSFSVNGTQLTVTNNGGTNIDVKLLVFLI